MNRYSIKIPISAGIVHLQANLIDNSFEIYCGFNTTRFYDGILRDKNI